MTDKHEYNSDQNVRAFTHWASEHAPTLSISLNFKSTWAVPGGLDAQVTGLSGALANYVWKSEGTVSGSWVETAALLAQFRIGLDDAISAKNNEAAFKACERIIKWGGDRNTMVGAMPFLRDLVKKKELVAYLILTRKDFSLNTATLAGTLSVRKMNSMLTKVHALASKDGLPIYDSRVAAAIAALVEMWRCAVGRSAEELPEFLSFPATLGTRTVHHLYDSAKAPGLLLYGKANEKRTAFRWGEAKIRLGWLMESILAQQPKLFAGGTTDIERMHALEASLFMVGYDVACLSQQP